MPVSNDRMSRRACATALGALVLVAVVVPVLAPGAGATAREGFEVTPSAGVDKQEYPALVGVNPQTQVNINNPSDCRTQTYCDTIPFIVKAPENLGEDDNFYVTITVAWEDPNKSNDVDVIVFDNGQLQGGATTRMGKSTTSNNPERVDLQQPTLEEYNLVVQNSSGVNSGYVVSAKMFMGKFESPVEQLAPPSQSGSSTTSTTFAKPEESLEPPTTMSATTLAPIAVTHDDSLDFSASDFQTSVSQIPTDDFENAAALRRPPVERPPSTIALIIWFVIAPILVCGSAVAIVYRRRRGLLFS